MNPFYNPQQQPTQSYGQFGNMFDVMNRFNEFRSSFQGDPRQKVQEMLNNGQMSQQQFNQLSTMAQFFKNFIH